ncbi:MAG: ribonuclease P protein component [Flavobacteriales bacterium]
MRATFRKHERLTGRDRIQAVVKEGRSVHEAPIRLTGLVMPLEPIAQAQVAFAIPKRHVRLATQRNRIRRQMREVYRLNKERWYATLREADKQCAWLFVYQSGRPLPWKAMQEKITRSVDRWIQQHVRAGQ